MAIKLETQSNVRGGKGDVNFKYLLGDKELNGKNRLFAELTIKPGCSIGYHVHQGESETYYIISGTGKYDDNGTTRTVKPGDVTFTDSGCGHAIENAGSENLVFMALIILA